MISHLSSNVTPLLHLVAKQTIGTDFYALVPPEERDEIKSLIVAGIESSTTPINGGVNGEGAGNESLSGGGRGGGGGGGQSLDNIQEAEDQKPELASKPVRAKLPPVRQKVPT